MTVTPNSDAAPWDGGPRDPYSPPPGQPPLEPVRQSRAGRLRWLVAVLATVLVLGTVAGVFLLANPPAASGGVSALARFAPDGSAMYGELRLDLPGDQRDNVIEFMSHFPGFADPATFDQKISDTLDELLEAGQDEVGWQTDIEPWFGGQVVFFTGELEGPQGTPQGGTVAFSVKDRAALDAFLDGARDHADYEESEHRGVTIRTMRVGGERTSLAALDDALLVSYRIEDIHAALDVNAGAAAALTDADRFKTAVAKLNSDRLAALYLDGEAIRASVEESMGSFALGNPFAAQLEQYPGTIVGQLRAVSDHLVFEMRMTPRAGQTFPNVPQDRVSTLVSRFPADVVGYVEVRDLGEGIRLTLDQMLQALGEVGMDDGSLQQSLLQAEQFLGTRPADFLDFVGDTAVAFSADGTRYGGGLIASVDDENVARQRLDRLVTSLRTVLAFAGPDVPVTIEEETHGDATLTVFRLRGDVPGMDELAVSSFSYTVTGGYLLMGADDFVKDALSRAESDSLAANDRFRRVLQEAGEANGGFFYVNIGQLRTIIETHVSAEERSEAAEVWPFFERFSHLISSVESDGEELVARFLLFVE